MTMHKVIPGVIQNMQRSVLLARVSLEIEKIIYMFKSIFLQDI